MQRAALRNIAAATSAARWQAQIAIDLPDGKESTMKVRSLRPIAVAALVAASLGAACAHAEGLYVGAGLGFPDYRDSVNGIGGSGSGTSGKLLGGFQYSPNFALELGVAGLAHIDNGSGSVNGHAVYLDAVGIAPLSDRWSLLGRIGLADVSLNTSAGDDSGTGLKVGLGAQYSLSREVALRAEWERYQPSVFGTSPNIDQYTFGVRVGF
jgi:OmpA-OmpF porin, OOP family